MSRKNFSLERRSEIVSLEIQPTVCKCPSLSARRGLACDLPFLYGFSAVGGSEANRVCKTRQAEWTLTMVLSEARGLWLFLVIRRGIACNG